MDHLIDSGFQDLFRDLHQNETGHYTWWTHRNNCRQRNIGWRIDYFFTTKKIAQKVKSCEILKNVMGSDHAPVCLSI